MQRQNVDLPTSTPRSVREIHQSLQRDAMVAFELPRRRLFPGKITMISLYTKLTNLYLVENRNSSRSPLADHSFGTSSSVFVETDNDYDKQTSTYFNYDMAKAIPKIAGGEVIMVRENADFNQFLLECKNTPVPSYCVYPRGELNANYRQSYNNKDYCMKTIYLVQEYWTNIQEYSSAGNFETSDGWRLVIPKTEDFVTGICQLIGLNPVAFKPAPDRMYIKKYSIHVELRAHWNITSKVLMALGEIGQRTRMFPLLLNIFDKHPVVAQNFQTARKMMISARDLKYEILRYATENKTFPGTIEEIHTKVLKMSRDAPQPFENQIYQFDICRILPAVIFDAFSVEKVLQGLVS